VRDLLLVVPSRERPHNIARLLDAMTSTCQAQTDLVVGLDWDDPSRGAYPGIPELPAHGETPYIVPGPDPLTEYELRDGLRQVVGWMNVLAMPRLDGYRAIGHIGDDNVPRTPGWDVQVMEALERQPFAYANDLYGRPGPPDPSALCCHIFMRSVVGKALGFIGTPHTRHMYVDAAWMQWGLATGIEYLEQVIVEHMHYTAGKAPPDASYLASTSLMPADAASYNAYCQDPRGLARDIAVIRSALQHESLIPDQDTILQRNRNLNIPPGPVRADWQPGMPLH
jgi:hypothetical protein